MLDLRANCSDSQACFLVHKDVTDSSKPDSVMESTTDAAEWKLKVERVLLLLKVHIRTDNKVQFAIDVRILQIWQIGKLKISAFQSFYSGNMTFNCHLI